MGVIYAGIISGWESARERARGSVAVLRRAELATDCRVPRERGGGRSDEKAGGDEESWRQMDRCARACARMFHSISG